MSLARDGCAPLADAVPPLVAMLRDARATLRDIAMQALTFLSLGGLLSADRRNGIVPFVVSTLRQGGSSMEVESATWFVKALCHTGSLPELLHAGVVPLILPSLQQQQHGLHEFDSKVVSLAAERWSISSIYPLGAMIIHSNPAMHTLENGDAIVTSEDTAVVSPDLAALPEMIARETAPVVVATLRCSSDEKKFVAGAFVNLVSGSDAGEALVRAGVLSALVASLGEGVDSQGRRFDSP